MLASSYKSGSTGWMAGDSGLHLEIASSARTFLILATSLIVPVYHTRYLFEPDVTLLATPSVTGRVGVGFGIRL